MLAHLLLWARYAVTLDFTWVILLVAHFILFPYGLLNFGQLQ